MWEWLNKWGNVFMSRPHSLHFSLFNFSIKYPLNLHNVWHHLLLSKNLLKNFANVSFLKMLYCNKQVVFKITCFLIICLHFEVKHFAVVYHIFGIWHLQKLILICIVFNCNTVIPFFLLFTISVSQFLHQFW